MSASSSTNDLRNRIIFTILILAVYRFGTFVPLPGIDPEQLKIMMEGNQKGLLGMFNVFAGGAVSRMAIFALGIMPYISSSIIVQLLTGVSDYFNGINPEYEFEERVFDMGQIGDVNEPMLNYTLGLINSRIDLVSQTELFRFIDDNFKFDFFAREMYIEDEVILKTYENQF